MNAVQSTWPQSTTEAPRGDQSCGHGEALLEQPPRIWLLLLCGEAAVAGLGMVLALGLEKRIWAAVQVVNVPDSEVSTSDVTFSPFPSCCVTCGQGGAVCRDRWAPR